MFKVNRVRMVLELTSEERENLEVYCEFNHIPKTEFLRKAITHFMKEMTEGEIVDTTYTLNNRI